MTILLLVVFGFLLLVAWISLRDQLREVRSEFGMYIARLDDRLQWAEKRLRELEISVAQKMVAREPAVEPAAAPEPLAAPQPPPVPAIVHSRVAEPTPFVAPPVTSAMPPLEPVVPVQSAHQPPALPQSTFELKPPPGEKATPPEHVLSLEERLGENWLNKLGVTLLVIGLAFFLALRLKTMGPGGKVLTGFAIGFAMLSGGVWLERTKQAYRLFARAGIGGGWALIFFTTYAMHHLAAARIIDSVVVDLILMLLVAAGMVAHSLLYKSQTVTGLAFGLAFVTVGTSHLESAGGSIAGAVFFSLWASALLAVGLVVVTTKRHWAWLELAGLVAVYANHFLWLSLVMAPMSVTGRFALFWPSTVLILFYWLLFRVAYLLRKPLDAEEDRISSLSAVMNAGGVLGLLKYQSAHPEWTFWALLAMGLAELALGTWARGRRRSAFVVLTTVATVLLVAAVPYKFHGVSWPVLWLVEAHVLALCGLRLGEPVFRRLGLLAGFAAGAVLAVRDVAPLMIHFTPGRHASAAFGLSLAALLYWVHGEVYPRRWPDAVTNEFEELGLKATSWLGLTSGAAAIWIVLPGDWVAVGWLALVLALGLAADWKRVVSVALQADLLAIAGIFALVVWDFFDAPNGISKLPALIGIGLLYVGMRRRTVPEGWPFYVGAANSWPASLLLMLWIGEAIDEKWMTFAWVALAGGLFGTGAYFRKGFLRWQAFVGAVLACFLLQVHWTEHIFSVTGLHGWFQVGWQDVVSMICVVTLLYWLQERAGGRPRQEGSTSAEGIVGIVAGVSGTLIVASWLPVLAPSWGRAESAAIVNAMWAVGLLGIALKTRRAAFQAHAVLIAVGVGLYGALLLATGSQPEATLPWYEGNLFRMGLAAAILLAGLPFAFALRKLEGWRVWPSFVSRPEQWFFFVAFGLMIVTLSVELRSGMWTLGWSLLGVGAFIFALLVGQRSFRLGGLVLLLVSVVKVLLMDVWALSPADRYTTLIGMGCALLLVSFLYTRFREIFRRYL